MTSDSRAASARSGTPNGVERPLFRTDRRPASLAILWLVGTGILLSPRLSPGNPAPKRKVAVLEFRSGSSELADIEKRVARVLKTLTSIEIVDSEAARKLYGASLDRDIVRCAGRASCVSRVAVKLEVAEVLLVGISEFGDVILTLQRIKTSTAEVETRIAEALAPGVDPDTKMIAQYLRRVMPESDFIQFGILRIQTPLRGASVTVNKKNRGTTPIEPLRVNAPASYEILVSKVGYTPFRASVLVPPEGKISVRANLVRKLQRAWYKTWWAATIAATVIVGSTALIVVGTRPEVTQVPVEILPF